MNDGNCMVLWFYDFPLDMEVESILLHYKPWSSSSDDKQVN